MPCSGLTLHTSDGSHLLARTMDFDVNHGAKLMVIPRKWPIKPALSAEETIESPYAQLAMGVIAGGLINSLDGVNEHGLCGAVFYYPGFAHYAGPSDGKTPLDPAIALQLALAICKDLDEAAKMFEEKTTLVADPSPVLGITPPLHYLLSDASGEAMVVEPDSDGLKIHRDTVGVLTNSPDYRWQETNLRNYLAVDRDPLIPYDMEARTLKRISPNAAMWGLPGDYSSVSRFVRTANMKRFIRLPADEAEGVTTAFHALSAMDVPQVELKEGEAEVAYTMYTAVMAPISKRYYFHTYENRRVQAASLDRENLDAAELKFYAWHDGQDVCWRDCNS